MAAAVACHTESSAPAYSEKSNRRITFRNDISCMQEIRLYLTRLLQIRVSWEAIVLHARVLDAQLNNGAMHASIRLCASVL
jgi:hypothetical protein